MGGRASGDRVEKKLVEAPLVFGRMENRRLTKEVLEPCSWIGCQLISSSCLGFLPHELEITRFGWGLKELI